MSNPLPLLRLVSLTRCLKSGDREITVLNHVDLAIEQGEFVAILGPSGSGKSTMLSLMAGLDKPSSGEVLFEDQAIQTLSEDALAILRRDKIGFVFQTFQLLSHLTARENVMLPLELRHEDHARTRADDLLRSVGLGERGHHYPTQLSGGEQQRVALARAFAAEPLLLLADEPTGNLDSATGTGVLDILIQLHRVQGVTLVLVTHDEAVAQHADRLVYLRDGKIEREEVAAHAKGSPK
jgi:putative ABC transport system ATP-binding protein